MIGVRLQAENDFAEWREAARALAAGEVAPDGVEWLPPSAPDGLFADDAPPVPVSKPSGLVAPKAFIELAETVLCHRAPERFSRLYRTLLRLQTERALLYNPVDDDVVWLRQAEKSIRRDMHKMKAFVRFRKIEAEGEREAFVAWFEPQHYIVERVGPFFVRRFTGMDWTILTPDRSVAWRGGSLSFGPGARREDAPSSDAVEEQWKAYFASIFNPSRVKIAAMTSEMPKKYWKNLPEAALIPDLIAGAETRARAMRENAVSAPNIRARKIATAEALDAPEDDPETLDELAVMLRDCRRCPLYQDATQAVAGEGPLDARLMLIGEQPGDREDLAGKPFVGPAGEALDRALKEAGLDRSALYVTNAVKHFKFEPRGKLRQHRTPAVKEVAACNDWLHHELQLVKPKVALALGATAARAIVGSRVMIKEARTRKFPLAGGATGLATIHPSYLLRLSDPRKKESEYNLFVEDLARAWRLAA